jgi:hypothetical protein
MTQLSRTLYFKSEAHKDNTVNLHTWAAALCRDVKCAGKILECMFGKALSLYVALAGYEQAMEVVGTGQQSVMILLQENCQAQLWHTEPYLSEFTRSLIGMFKTVPRAKNMYVYAEDTIAVPTEVKEMGLEDAETPWDARATYNLATGHGPFTEAYFNNWNAHRGPEVHLPEGVMRAILLHTSDHGQADNPQGQQFWELSAIDTLLLTLETNKPGYDAYDDLVLQYLQNPEGESWVSKAVDNFLDMMRSKGAFSRIEFCHRMRRLNQLSDAVADAVVFSPSVPFSLSVSFSPSLGVSFALSLQLSTSALCLLPRTNLPTPRRTLSAYARGILSKQAQGCIGGQMRLVPF